MTQKRCSLNQSTLTVLLALFVIAPVSGQQSDTSDDPPVVASKEYIFHQQADVDLVIRVSAFEAAFTTFVSSEMSGKLSEAGLPDARMLPVFHYVSSTDTQRQIEIDVNATQTTNRTEFDMQVTRLDVRDERTSDIANAYRLLGSGLQLMQGGNASQWTVRIQTLFSAANLFEKIGMEEMRLWSRSYGAHLILRQLRDYQTAIDWADELLGEPRISRYPEIEFLARKLKSSAMLEGRIGIGGEEPVNSPYQAALAATGDAARALDYKFEEAKALMAVGVDLIDHGLHRQAQGHLQEALAIAVDIEAADLAAAIREQMVETHSQVGDLDRTGDILEDIETHLLAKGEQQELALNLIQQGRIHIGGFRYSEAIDVLTRALALEQSGLSQLEAQLDLGMALSASGRNDEALSHLQRALVNPQTGEFRRPSDVLNVTAALYEMAAIFRHHRNWDQLQKIRTAQQGYIDSSAGKANFVYQQAIDSFYKYGPASPTTRERFGQALRQSESAGQEAFRNLARLGLCALPKLSAGDSALHCNAGELQAAYRELQRSGPLSQKSESVIFYSRMLDRSGQARQAFRISDDLIETLIKTGYAPLGSWYWQWRDLLAYDYMDMAMKTEGNSRSDATQSLLALIKLRNLERGGSKFRAQMTPEDFRSVMRSLPADAVILSYRVTDSGSTAWVGERNKVRRYSLEGGDRIGNLCRGFRQALQTGASETYNRFTRELGSILLDPVADDLKNTIYFVNQAPLLGIPIDALRINGEALAMRHSLSQLELRDTSSLDNHHDRFPRPSTVFLAGDPQDWSGEFATSLEASEEVKAVNDLFVGPGLHAVQGVSLLRDEFLDHRYGQAELVHLSAPGIVDLSPRQKSALYLSEAARGTGREILDPYTLASMPVSTRLAFLSRTEFTGAGSALENRVGLVSSMLDAGASAVIASLWPVRSDFRKQFVEDFYTRLLNEQNILSALAMTKRNSIENGENYDWASFQLFLN